YVLPLLVWCCLTKVPATEPRDEDDEQEENALWQGNRWRNLWKTACTRAALDVRPPLPIGALGDNAVKRYTLFLTSLELSADVAERRLALARARQHRLDVERVVVVTAERTIEHVFVLLPPVLKGPLSRIAADKDEQPSVAETLLLLSIEWTVVFGEGT
ncbi:hypothetical protein OF83DRAFT_1173489, partial [Amylostereum chailletii]